MAAVRHRKVWLCDVPPEFELLHRSEDGDGAAFQSRDGALLAVWGTNVAEGDFLPQVKKQISRDEKEGWIHLSAADA